MHSILLVAYFRSAAGRGEFDALVNDRRSGSLWNSDEGNVLLLHGFSRGLPQARFDAVLHGRIQSGANHVVDLNWNASTSTDVAGYNVYRSPDGSNWKKMNASLVASTLYSDATVANGSTYYYATTAVDTHGIEGTKTPSVQVVIP